MDVYSSVPGGGYDGSWSGTSMAGPHIAGVVALMREACPNCDHITIKDAIMTTAHDLGPVGQDNQFGHGFIDAYDAVVAVSSLGRVNGFVRDVSNNPIVGARIGITSGPNFVLSAADGSFSLPLTDGTYTVECSAFGYITQSATNVVVVVDQITTRNFTLPLAAQGTVSGIVTDCNGGPAIGATVEVLNTPVPSTTTNSSGFYSITLPQGTYDMRASGVGCAPVTVNSVVVGANATQNFTLLSDPIYSCSDPDAYGYYACENGDAGGPTYAWTEIAPDAGGPGTDTGQSCDDCFTGPLAFPFPFQFYGVSYPSYNLGSNGYMTFSSGASVYGNDCLPQLGMPSGVYPFWDDLYTLCSTAQVATYYDAVGHRLIVEWYNTCHCCSEGNTENFQVIIYDVAFYPTATGDNDIAIQYGLVSSLASNTIGLQSESGGVSLQYVCEGSLDLHSQGVENGRVIYFTTGPGCDAGDPNITVNPTSLSGTAPLGGTDTGSLQICNTGLCPLRWTIDWSQTTPALALASYVPDNTIVMTKEQIDLIEAINNGEKPVINVRSEQGQSPLDAQGGPDAFGYRWIDSDEPSGPVYNWVEINGIGTNTGISSDDEVANVVLPFTFNFYGIGYTTVNISSNGNVHFGSANGAYTNLTLPNISAPLAMIAPFWDDLYPPTQGEVYTYYDAPNNRFVIEWDQIAHISGPTEIYTFEVILYSNGKIVTQYADMFEGGSYGVTTCTIGLNNETGSDGLQVVYDASYLHDNMAIEFKAATEWLTMPPPLNGSLEPGFCTNVVVTFDAADLPAGTYTGDIVVQSTDPDNSTQLVPVSFVGGSFAPPTGLTIYYLNSTNQLRFEWVASGAPYYQLFSSTDSGGPFATLEGGTASNSLVLPYDSTARKFFILVATDAP